MTLFLITLALVLIATYLFYKYVTTNYNYWNEKCVPSTPPLFPFGNFQNVLLGRESLGVFLEKLYNSHHSKITGFYIFQKPYLLIRSPEVIKNILVKDFNYFNDRNVFSDHKIDPIGTKTLFILPNPEWKPTRVKVTPFFTTSKMKNMLKLIQNSCDEMIDYLKENKNKNNTYNAKEVCAKFTTDVISNCAFGVKSFCFENENAPFRLIGEQMFGISLLNGFTFISYFLMPTLVKIFKMPVYNKQSTDFLKSVFWKAIEEREEEKSKRNDLIDIIIQMKKEGGVAEGFDFEGDTVVAQALQFYIAGFETTSSTLSMILYQLSLHTDIQTKLREEIFNTGDLNYENLASLNYMDQVIYETLRMFPPLPFLDRKCKQDYKIPEMDVVVEKGTPVFISMLGLHYDPEYYPNPNIFDPERFSGENVSKRPTYAYMPFGHGPRNCIGERFGMMTVKMSLAKLLQTFVLEKTRETPEDIVYNPVTILLQPLHDLPIKFIPFR